MRNPVARVTVPSSTALAARIPRAPRSGSSSVALPAVAALAVARRSAQVTRVPGFARAMRASSMIAVAAEWPAPRTTVCLPANGAGAAKSGIWYLTRPSPAAARSPRAGSPSAPAGFGCRHVPDASMTARASSLRSFPPRSVMCTVNGWSPRPASTRRSRPLRDTPVTRAPYRTRPPSASASGRRYPAIHSAPVG